LLEFDIESVLSSLPEDIDAMYGKILQEDIHKDHRPLAIKVLRWLAVSYRPLSVMEIAEACTIPQEHELKGATTLRQDHRLTHEQLLKLLANLVVSIQADWPSGEERGYTSLTFSHFSVKEYLMGSQLLESPSASFRVQPRDAHSLVAKECLAYIFIAGAMKWRGCLESYANEHWQLHAITTGEMDEETRRTAFLLSASTLTVAEELPEVFVRATQWLEDPASKRKLISYLKEYHLTRDGTRLVILYPQDGSGSTIRCGYHKVSPMYTPSFEVIYGFQSKLLQVRIQMNGQWLLVSEEPFDILQSLRQTSNTVRLIYLSLFCRDVLHDPGNYGAYRHAERVVVHLGGKPENEKWGFGFLGRLWNFSPLSSADLTERRRLNDCLLALEKLLSVRRGISVEMELYSARDVIFLHNCVQFSWKDIRKAFDQHQPAPMPRPNFFSLDQRPMELYNEYLRNKGVPRSMAMLNKHCPEVQSHVELAERLSKSNTAALSTHRRKTPDRHLNNTPERDSMLVLFRALTFAAVLGAIFYKENEVELFLAVLLFVLAILVAFCYSHRLFKQCIAIYAVLAAASMLLFVLRLILG
jgi:hypothetical protein